ncbi:MAG: hypothetical protein R3F62_17340 [Planctomycetota bacterium]
MREVREEFGIADEVEVVEQLAANRYAFRTPEGKAIFDRTTSCAATTPRRTSTRR